MAGGLLLVDGWACLTRVYYAVSPRLGSKGRFQSAAHGLLSLIFRLVRSHRPQYLAVLFEEPPVTTAIPKALWSQRSAVEPLLEASGVPRIERRGLSFAQLAEHLIDQAKGKGISTLLVTTRTSLLSLVQPDVTLMNPAGGGLLLRPHHVMLLYGVPPEQIPDWLTLVGDPAEGIPGIQGIGPKRAAQLLKKFRSIQGILNALEKLPLTGSNRIRIGQSRLKRVQTPGLNLSLEECTPSSPDPAQVASRFTEAGLSDLIESLVPHRHPESVRYETILTESGLKALREELEAAARFAIDTETTGLDPGRAQLVGISISLKPHTGFYIPVLHQYPGAPPQLPMAQVVDHLKGPLMDRSKLKIGQNLKFDLLVLQQAGLSVQGTIFDTLVASYLVHPDRRSHSLDALALAYFRYKMIPIHDLIGPDRSMAQVEIPTVTEYACEDADLTLQLYERLTPELKNSGVSRLFDEVEMPFLLALTQIEGQGILIDPDQARILLEESQERSNSLAEEIFSLAGERFNLESPKELRRILFDRLELKRPRQTRTRQASLSRASLEAIAPLHPIVQKLIRHQDELHQVQKKLSAICDRLDPTTGRFRSGVHPAATAAGQLKIRPFPFPSLVRAADSHLLLEARFLELRERLLALGLGSQRILMQAKRQGQVTTLLGRVRALPQLNSPNPVLRRSAEREALETFLAGSQTDLLKLAVVQVWSHLQNGGLFGAATIDLILPEGLLLELQEEKLREVAVLVRRTMEQVTRLKVPLEVRMSVGQRWNQMTPIAGL